MYYISIYINSNLLENMMEIKVKFKRNIPCETLKKKLNEKGNVFI